MKKQIKVPGLNQYAIATFALLFCSYISVAVVFNSQSIQNTRKCSQTISYFIKILLCLCGRYNMCINALPAVKVFLSYDDIVGTEIQVMWVHTRRDYLSNTCTRVRTAVRQSRRARLSAARAAKNRARERQLASTRCRCSAQHTHDVESIVRWHF